MAKDDQVTATATVAVAAADEHYDKHCILPLYYPLSYHLCVDGTDGENIPDEEIAAAVAVGASVIELRSTVSDIAVVWSD